MKFQPGDPVSFINEKQNGIISKVLPGGKVLVQIEDGFDLEVSEKELVKSGFIKKEVSGTENLPVPHSLPSTSINELINEGSISLIAMPASIGAVLTGSVNYFVVNRTNHEFICTVYIRLNRKMKGVYAGIIAPDEHSLFYTAKREHLTDVESILIEGLLYSQDYKPVRHHIRKETGIILPDLISADKSRSGEAAFAKIFELFNDTVAEEFQVKELADKWNTGKIATKPGLTEQGTKYPAKGKTGVYINEKEVDLHIEELVADFSGLSNAEIISLQMKRFSEEMTQAIKSHLKRIVFIHGVGRGVLKSEIRKELSHYKGIRVKEADISRYGNGATEVIFE